MSTVGTTAQLSEARVLVDNLKASRDENKRIDALSKIYDKTNTDIFKTLLANSSFGLLAELKASFGSKTGLEQEWAAACICQLGINDNNKVLLSSRQLGLMPIVMANISKYENCFTIMTNICLRPENHDYLLSSEVGLMRHLMTTLDDFQPSNMAKDEKHLKILSNIASCLKPANLFLFMSYNTIECNVRRLLVSNESDIRHNNGYGYWILNFLNRISYHPVAASRMKELNAVSFLTNLMATHDIAGLKATIAVSNMVGKDEANSVTGKSMIESQSQKFSLLLKLFKATLMKDVGPDAEDCKKLHGYLFGMIKMRNICGAIRTLSISDTNKPLMLKTNVVELLIRTLKLFTSNALQLNILVNNMDQTAGGGGDDDETAAVAIEALLQLSFNYEMDEKLREEFTRAACELDIIEILNGCATDPRGKLDNEAKRNASALLKRLRAPTVFTNSAISAAANQVSVPAKSVSDKHIMFSYSWAVNKHLVVAMAQKLREMGHDVWRDEEGSNILSAMSGDANEKMAQAIEAAHTVVIFVSPQYKESGNCRTEAKYSRQRQLISPLKIIYVMLCENYHTRSNPPVDGWLALNIGTDIWYPLWNASMISSTAQAINDNCGASMASGGASFSPPPVSYSPPPSAYAPQPAAPIGSSSGVDVDAAWTLLKDPSSSSNPDSLIDLMDQIGISDKGDLLLLEDEELHSLTQLMKPLKQRKFLSALQKSK